MYVRDEVLVTFYSLPTVLLPSSPLWSIPPAQITCHWHSLRTCKSTKHSHKINNLLSPINEINIERELMHSD